MKLSLAAPLALSLVALVSGCSLIPGLRVSMSDHEGIAETRTAGDEEVRMLEDQSGPIAGLRIVTLSPKTLIAENQASKALATAAMPPPVGPYRIGPNDVINVIVWDHPELTNPNGEYRDAITAGRLVDEDGTMYYPYVGVFKAAGMTVAELRDFIGKQLVGAINKPQVDARVVAFRSRKIQVSGEVRQPGLVTLDDTEKGLIEAINERGGLTDNASRRVVELIRGDQRYLIDQSKMVAGGSGSVLAAGDRIYVPDHSIDSVFVLGQVNKEGPVFLQQHRTSLVQVLTAAGGLNETASNQAGVLVFRAPTGGDRMATVYRAPLSSAVGLLLAGQFELDSRDIVYVGPTAFAAYNSVINQLLPTISAVFQVDALVRNR